MSQALNLAGILGGHSTPATSSTEAARSHSTRPPTGGLTFLTTSSDSNIHTAPSTHILGRVVSAPGPPSQQLRHSTSVPSLNPARHSHNPHDSTIQTIKRFFAFGRQSPHAAEPFSATTQSPSLYGTAGSTAQHRVSDASQTTVSSSEYSESDSVPSLFSRGSRSGSSSSEESLQTDDECPKWQGVVFCAVEEGDSETEEDAWITKEPRQPHAKMDDPMVFSKNPHKPPDVGKGRRGSVESDVDLQWLATSDCLHVQCVERLVGDARISIAPSDNSHVRFPKHW